MRIFDYDNSIYNFRNIISGYLDITDLENLNDNVELYTPDTDQTSQYHKAFYAKIDDQFHTTYFQFIKDIILPIYGESVVYQKIPTFRVHLPNNLSVGEFHRDRDYNHTPHETNYFLPLTKAFDTNTIWIESEDGKEDYTPMELDYGQICEFKGVDLKHGNKQNTTGQARVSFDFRIIPYSKYQPGDKTCWTGMDFAIGGYFELCEKPNK